MRNSQDRELDKIGAEPTEAVAAAEINPRDVRLAAMDLLARREHLQRELQIKLNKRFGECSHIGQVLSQLQQEGLQSDERYCESYVRQRAGKGYGPDRIRMEMRQKGAASELVKLALVAAEVDWLALARGARCKKFGASTPTELKDKSRQLRFLQYRGFASDTASRALLPDPD